MLQQDHPNDYVIATGVSHSVREFCEIAFQEAGIQLEWQGAGTSEIGIVKSTTFTQTDGESELPRPGKKVVAVDPKNGRSYPAPRSRPGRIDSPSLRIWAASFEAYGDRPYRPSPWVKPPSKSVNVPNKPVKKARIELIKSAKTVIASFLFSFFVLSSETPGQNGA